MPQFNNSKLSIRLEPEAREWVKDLGSHQGWLVFCQAVEELMAMEYRALRLADELPSMYQAQGKLEAYEMILSLREKLVG